MQLLDVRPDHLQIVQDILKKHVPERDVWAFGSRAKWLAKEYSDLDLCIVGKIPLSFTTLGLLKEAFDESDLPWKVDVVDWATTSESFRTIIERDKVVVQGVSKNLCVVGEWITTRLGDVATINPDVIRRNWQYAHIRYVDITSVGDGYVEVPPAVIDVSDAPSRAKRLVKRGDSVLSTVRPNRRSMFFVSQPVDDWVVSTGFAVLRPKMGLVDPRFLYACVFNRSFTDYLITREKGAAYPAVAPEDIADAEIALPPIEEQRAIAHILGTLDDKIELNRWMNETLEAMARTLFKAWFVDFEPVRAKLEGRWQRGQSLPGLPAHLFDLFPDRLVESELGEIPEGWTVGTLADYSSLNPESWSKKGTPDEIEYVDLANTKRGTIETAARLPWAEAPSRAQRILRTGDTIVGTVRPGNGSFALISTDGLTGSTGFAVLRPNKHIFRDFVFVAATSAENIERLSHLADGAAYPAVRPDVVLASPVPIPESTSLDGIIKSFSDTVGNWVDLIEHNKRECQNLAQLRDTLLPKLISGELRIVDAEKFAEAIQ